MPTEIKVIFLSRSITGIGNFQSEFQCRKLIEISKRNSGTRFQLEFSSFAWFFPMSFQMQIRLIFSHLFHLTLHVPPYVSKCTQTHTHKSGKETKFCDFLFFSSISFFFFFGLIRFPRTFFRHCRWLRQQQRVEKSPTNESELPFAWQKFNFRSSNDFYVFASCDEEKSKSKRNRKRANKIICNINKLSQRTRAFLYAAVAILRRFQDLYDIVKRWASLRQWNFCVRGRKPQLEQFRLHCCSHFSQVLWCHLVTSEYAKWKAIHSLHYSLKFTLWNIEMIFCHSLKNDHFTCRISNYDAANVIDS